MIEPTTETLERLIRSYVAEGSEIAPAYVIPGEENSPSPVVLYATVTLIASTQEGLGWATAEVVAGTSPPVVSQEARVSLSSRYSVQFYRKGARDAAETFRAWTSSPLGQLAAERRRLTFYHCSDVHQVDQIVSEQWEPRAAVDIAFGLVVRSTTELPTFGGREIAIRYDDEPEQMVGDPCAPS